MTTKRPDRRILLVAILIAIAIAGCGGEEEDDWNNDVAALGTPDAVSDGSARYPLRSAIWYDAGFSATYEKRPTGTGIMCQPTDEVWIRIESSNF